MDEVALAVLAAELEADGRVMAEAVATARDRFGHGSLPEAEAAAYHLSRAYNAAETAALRVARSFENTIHANGGWHANLLRRMTLDIPGVRPALLDNQALDDLMELRAFRHTFRHAYDLRIRGDRIAQLIPIATRAASRVQEAMRGFIASVARMHNLADPGGAA